MHNMMQTGFDFDWSEDSECPLILAFYDATKSYITGRSLDDTLALGPRAFANRGIAWSVDGQVLYTVDEYTRLICIDFTRELRPSVRRDITPREWTPRVEKVLGIWPSPSESEVYCFTLLRKPYDTALWCVSTDGNEARRMLSGERRLHMGANVQLTEQGALVTETTEDPGVVVCRYISTDVRKELQVSTERICMPTMSPCGKYCVFVTIPEDGEHELNLYDVATGQSEFLAHATYASWSPDSRYLAAVLADAELFLIDVESRFARVVLSRREGAASLASRFAVAPPLWSCDGSWLVFRLSEPRKLSQPQLTRWIVAGQSLSDSETEPDDWCNVDPRTFVLNVREKSIIRLPIASDYWAWRPMPVV